MKCVVFIFVLLTGNVFAQKLAVSDSLSNPAAMQRHMQLLATKVIELYTNADKRDYYDDLFRYALVAERYTQSAAYIDSVIKVDSLDTWPGLKAVGIGYKSYALAKEAQKKDSRPFNLVYTDAMAGLYNQLPEKARPFVDGFLSTEPAVAKKTLDEQLKKVASKDSIDITTAGELLKSYATYTVFAAIQMPAANFMAAEEKKEYIIYDSVLIPTRSGAKLNAVVVQKKSNAQPSPVVLLYNIYASRGDKSGAKDIAQNGYVGIVVNTRGKALSPDAIEPFEHDAVDAYDVLDWISKQPWCNGKVGMFGGSYLGFSQWSAVKKVHPVLKTIVPQVSVGIGIDYPMHNNVFMSYMLQWIHYVTNNKGIDRPEFSNSAKWDSVYNAWYVSGKSFRALDSIDGRPNYLFQRWLNHPTHDAFWRNMVPYANEFANINIPILTTTGYYDDDQRGAFYYYLKHLAYNPTAKHYLLIGPWDHGGAQSAAYPVIRGYHIDSAANIVINETVYKWFDHILKDSALPARLKNKVNYEVMGANEWRNAPSVDAISNSKLSLYLSNVVSKGTYQLLSALPAKAGTITQEVDFKDRSVFNKTHFDYNIVDTVLQVADGMVFKSEPLKADLTIAGSFDGMLKLETNKKDFDYTLELYEQRADGKYQLLSTHLARASYNKDHDKRTLLVPGTKQVIPIYNTFFTAAKLSKGSRIVLVLGINNNPQWQINYGTGKEVSDETIKDAAIPLQINWSNRSYIRLPIAK
jgi:uncharacterized protein